jgi:hypothetical protein
MNSKNSENNSFHHVNDGDRCPIVTHQNRGVLITVLTEQQPTPRWVAY